MTSIVHPNEIDWPRVTSNPASLAAGMMHASVQNWVATSTVGRLDDGGEYGRSLEKITNSHFLSPQVTVFWSIYCTLLALDWSRAIVLTRPAGRVCLVELGVNASEYQADTPSTAKREEPILERHIIDLAGRPGARRELAELLGLLLPGRRPLCSRNSSLEAWRDEHNLWFVKGPHVEEWRELVRMVGRLVDTVSGFGLAHDDHMSNATVLEVIEETIATAVV
jgi:hypothetical protein